MEKITTFIAIVLLLPLAAIAQHTEGKNPYLIQAPYDGLHGKVDSVVITTYLPKDSVGTNALLTTKEYAKRLALMKGTVSEETFVAFDPQGYFTRRRESKINEYGELEVNSKWEVPRDQHSLPTKLIFRTPTDGTVTEFRLESRKDGKEIYKTPRQRGAAPSIATRVEQIIEYSGNTLTTRRIYPAKYETRYKYVYNKDGQNIYWTDKMADEDNFVEYFSTYNEKGLLTQTEKKTFNVNPIKDELASDKIVNYIYYEFEKNTPHTPNWLTRIIFDEKNNVLGIEEQKIYYHLW